MAIRSLSVASNTAALGRERMQLVDALSAQMCAHHREQTGLLGPKAGERAPERPALGDYSHYPCTCVHMCAERAARGKWGSPRSHRRLKEGRNEQQADTRAQTDMCKDK